MITKRVSPVTHHFLLEDWLKAHRNRRRNQEAENEPGAMPAQHDWQAPRSAWREHGPAGRDGA